MDSFKHNVATSGAGQATHQQCWFASFGMMYKYYKMAGSIEDKLSGAGIDVATAKSDGMLDTDYGKAATALGFTPLSVAPFKETGYFDFDVSSGAYKFLDELVKGPLWCSRYLGPGMYHAVVATGYSDDGKGYIIYNNPFPGPTNAREVSTSTASMFVRDLTNAKGSVMAFR
ncbi:MAG: papain-like cysteine protease family protein [Acidobacteriota bacterium]